MKKIKFNRNVKLYMISTSLVSFSLGLFLLVFNLHITEQIDSSIFLSNFLFLGNVSMAVGGILFGWLIDKYPKRNILLYTTGYCAVLFFLESVVFNEHALYFISIFYGLGYAILMSIHTPILLQLTEGEENTHIFSFCSSFRLAGLTCGTIAGGFFPKITLNRSHGSQYQFILIVAAVVYLGACIPVLLMQKDEKGTASSEKTGGETRHSIFRKFRYQRGLITRHANTIIMSLGILIFFSPFMNLYFQNRYALPILQISGILSFIRLCPIATNILLTLLLKKTKEIHIIIYGCILCAGCFAGLAMFSHIAIQILLLTLSTMISTFVFPLIGKYVLAGFAQSRRGMMSGLSNFWYNAGDSVGTYSEGIFIYYALYNLPFMIAGILYTILIVLLGILHSRRVKA